MKPNSSSGSLGRVRVRERGVLTRSAVLSQDVSGPPVRHLLLPDRLIAEAPHPVGSSPWGTISSFNKHAAHRRDDLAAGVRRQISK
jgi:hypothetical protein